MHTSKVSCEISLGMKAEAHTHTHTQADMQGATVFTASLPR